MKKVQSIILVCLLLCPVVVFGQNLKDGELVFQRSENNERIWNIYRVKLEDRIEIPQEVRDEYSYSYQDIKDLHSGKKVFFKKDNYWKITYEVTQIFPYVKVDSRLTGAEFVLENNQIKKVRDDIKKENEKSTAINFEANMLRMFAPIFFLFAASMFVMGHKALLDRTIWKERFSLVARIIFLIALIPLTRLFFSDLCDLMGIIIEVATTSILFFFLISLKAKIKTSDKIFFTGIAFVISLYSIKMSGVILLHYSLFLLISGSIIAIVQYIIVRREYFKIKAGKQSVHC